MQSWQDDAGLNFWEATLVDRFGIHPRAERDCKQRNPVPKVHVYTDHLFVVLHAPERGARGHVHYVELDQFMGPGWIITVPGPLTLLHANDIAAGGAGRPSSVAVPVSEVVDGSVIVRSAPAFTTGAVLTGGGFTVIVTSSLTVTAPSVAVSRST